jgi:ligand-binding sensor protein
MSLASGSNVPAQSQTMHPEWSAVSNTQSVDQKYLGIVSNKAISLREQTFTEFCARLRAEPRLISHCRRPYRLSGADATVTANKLHAINPN